MSDIERIDLSSERAKPVPTIPAFKEKLSQYSAASYHGLFGGPYDDLLDVCRYQVGLFDQFKEILKDDALVKGVSEKEIDDTLAVFKAAYLDNLAEAKDILDFIDKVEADPDTFDKVSVLPLMCGSGKSTAITLKIKEVIEHNDGTGMLIVTDSKARLNDIWDKNTTNPLLGEDVKTFIREHQKDVTIMTSENFPKAARDEKMRPVLAMTSQRYFQLSRDEIDKYLTWKIDRGRTLLLFDEEPYLNETYDLTVKTVNDIDTVLRMVFDDDPHAKDEKQWCIQQWSAFREKFLSMLWRYEYQYGYGMLYVEDENHAITEDDDRFWENIIKHRSDIRHYDTEVLKGLRAVKAFADSWGIYSYRSYLSGAYESKITVFVDNRDKVTDLGSTKAGLRTKVIVLDGTGDISPTYSGQDYIDVRSGSNFIRSLSHLSIRLGDIATSKTVFDRPDRGFIPKAITSYLQSLGYTSENTYIFTYKTAESKFKPPYNERTAHFGNIKGLNKYMDADCIAQVGLNQLQPVHYLVHMLARNEDLRFSLIGLPPKEMDERIRKIMELTNNCADFAIAHVLADIDQNMFRSAIRSAKNNRDVVYYLFYMDASFPGLKDAVRKRYHDQLRANIAPVPEAFITAIQVAQDAVARRKIQAWHDSWDGKPIKLKDVLASLEMSRNTFKSAVSRDAELKALFEQDRKTAKDSGLKNGWLKK